MRVVRRATPGIPQGLALERGERQEDRDDDELEAPTHGTLGRKATIPYALYLGYGFFNPHFARQTGVTPEDLNLFWDAMLNMWDLDRPAGTTSAMGCRTTAWGAGNTR